MGAYQCMSIKRASFLGGAHAIMSKSWIREWTDVYMDVSRTIENMICNDGDESDTEEQITDAPEKAFYKDCKLNKVGSFEKTEWNRSS